MSTYKVIKEYEGNYSIGSKDPNKEGLVSKSVTLKVGEVYQGEETIKEILKLVKVF
jgi:hypothetical protein